MLHMLYLQCIILITAKLLKNDNMVKKKTLLRFVHTNSNIIASIKRCQKIIRIYEEYSIQFTKHICIILYNSREKSALLLHFIRFFEFFLFLFSYQNESLPLQPVDGNLCRHVINESLEEKKFKKKND